MTQGVGGAAGSPASNRAAALYQVRDQPRLPRSPGRGTGGEAVGLDERGEQFEARPVADLSGDTLGGRRVVEVPSGRGVREKEVETDHLDQGLHVRGGQADPGADLRGHHHADLGVVTGESLADVVEERSEQQQVGALDPVGERRRVRGGLEQVPVDGVAVVRVALGFVAHGGPLGQVALEQVTPVDRLERGDRRGSRGEHSHQAAAQVVRPRLGWRGCLAAEKVQRVTRDREVPSGCDRGEAEREARVAARVGCIGQHDLTVTDREVGFAGRCRSARCRLTRACEQAASCTSHPVRPRRGASPSPGVVGFPGDRPAHGRDGAHQGIGVGFSEGGRNLVLLLEEELVELATGSPVQFDPDRGEHRAGVLDCDRIHVVGEDGYGLHHREERGDVAESAVRFLQVGLEEEADVAEAGASLRDLGVEDLEPGRFLPGPPGAGALEHRFTDFQVAADDPSVEQAQRHSKVLGSSVEDLVRLSDAVIERDPFVPHRVPDPVGEGADVLPSAVDEEDVEIAERAELAASVPADRDEGHPPRVALGRLVEEVGQPGVRFGRVRMAEGISSQVAALDERLAPIAEGHGRTVAPRALGSVARRPRSALATWALTLRLWPTTSAPDSPSSTAC